MEDWKTASAGERELESPLVWRLSLSLAMESVERQRVTADCGQDEVRLARSTIELDHFNGDCWTGGEEILGLVFTAHFSMSVKKKKNALTQLC